MNAPRNPRAHRELARAGVRVLREDNHLLVVAKRAGLASQGGSGIDVHVAGLVEAYRRQAEGKAGRAYVGLVHRLDRNVSGVMVLAKTSKAAARLAAVFRDRPPGLRKTYLAWVDGRPKQASARLVHKLRRANGRTFEAPDGRVSSLSYVVSAAGPHASRLQVDLETGFTHQIRAQLASMGHPLIGDVKYGGPRGRRPALHALRLVFPHPVRDGLVDTAAPPPPDLEQLERRLRIN